MIGFDLNSLKRKAEEAKKAILDATPVIIEKVDKAKKKVRSWQKKHCPQLTAWLALQGLPLKRVK